MGADGAGTPLGPQMLTDLLVSPLIWVSPAGNKRQ